MVAQHCPPDELTIIVVDLCSRDDSVEWASKAAREHRRLAIRMLVRRFTNPSIVAVGGLEPILENRNVRHRPSSALSAVTPSAWCGTPRRNRGKQMPHEPHARLALVFILAMGCATTAETPEPPNENVATVASAASSTGGPVTTGFQKRSSGGYFNLINQHRYVDTSTAGGPLKGGYFTWTLNSLPSGASSAWLTATVRKAASPGFGLLYPALYPGVPNTSTVNFAGGETTGHGAIVALDSHRSIALTASAAADWTLDVSGYFAGTGAGFVSHAGARLLDTRTVPGSRLSAGVVRTITLDPALVPSDATAVAVNVTTVLPSAAGTLVALSNLPLPSPATANLTFAGNDVVDSQMIAPVINGAITFYATAATDLIVDFTGAFRPGTGRAYSSVQPLRVADTRGTGTWRGKLDPNQTIDIDLAALTGFPADADAVFVNLATAGAAGPGFLVARPCGMATAPTTSALNFNVSDKSNGAFVKLDASRRFCITSSASTDLIVDLTGVF